MTLRVNWTAIPQMSRQCVRYETEFCDVVVTKTAMVVATRSTGAVALVSDGGGHYLGWYAPWEVRVWEL